MNTTTPGPPDEPWMTLAEIAQELRVNPATVRLWVSKGQLKATRAGMRKWVVRRSDLDRMLASVNSTAAKLTDRSVPDRPPAPVREPDSGSDRQADQFLPPIGTRESVTKLVELANESIVAAFRASASAPPSDGYPDRLRAIADGFEHFAATNIHAARTAGGFWSGREGWGPDHLPYEVRPGGNRPKREGLWDRFDRAFAALGTAMAGTDILAVAHAFRQVADELLTVADQLAEEDDQRADARVV